MMVSNEYNVLREKRKLEYQKHKMHESLQQKYDKFAILDFQKSQLRNTMREQAFQMEQA